MSKKSATGSFEYAVTLNCDAKAEDSGIEPINSSVSQARYLLSHEAGSSFIYKN